MYTNNQNVINVLNQKVVEVDKVDITVEDLDTILISGTLKDKGSLFTPIMTELEVQVKNDFSTFKNKEMNLARYIGTTGNIEVIDYGDFEIIKAEYDTINDATKLIGYNEMLRSQVPYDHEYIGASFPISTKDLLEKIAYFSGVDFQIIGVSSTRYNQMIPKDYWANDLSYTVRDIMTDVCELTTATLAIRNGKLTLFDPIDTGITINTGSGVLIKDKFGKTNIMNISYEPQHDNHYSPQNAVNKNSSEYIELEDRKELMFENNPIFLNDPQHYADTLLPRVKDLEYTVGDFKAYHMGIFQVGDIVHVNGYKWLITEQIYKLTNVLVEFKSEIPNAYQLQYVVESDQKRQGQSTSLTVDKLEGVINANITRLEEMTQDITDLNLDIDGIKGYVEGYKFDPININTSGEYGNYDNWTFYDVNDNLRNYPLLAHRKGMNQFTNFYIRKNPRSLAESDIVFFSERMAMNGIYRVFNQFDYGLKFQRVEGNQAFAIQIVEVDENYQETQIQTFMFTEQRLYEEVRNIKLHENTMYAGIRFVVTDVSLANPLAITETMFGIGAPKDYTQTANGVLQYAKGLFELQNDQAKLMIEDIQMINGRSIRNEAGLSVLSDNVNLLAQRTTSVEGNIGDLEDVIQDYDEDIGDLLSFKQSAEIDLKPENISLAVRQSSEYQSDIGELVRKDSVLAQINLSKEGVVIDGDKVQINGATKFASGYDPSTKATAQDIADKIDELNLGDLAYKDTILQAMEDETIIVGGFIKTSLISFDNAEGTNVNLKGHFEAVSGEIAGFNINGNEISSYMSDEDMVNYLRITHSGFVFGHSDMFPSNNYETEMNAGENGFLIHYSKQESTNQWSGVKVNAKEWYAYERYNEAGTITETSSGIEFNWGSLSPNRYNNGNYNLGSSGNRFNMVYLKAQPNVSSDARLKENIQEIPNDLIDLFMELEPKMYTQNGQVHFGYIAQDVEAMLNKWKKLNPSMADSDFALLDNEGEFLALIYGELAVLKNKQLTKRMEQLENEAKSKH